MCRELTVCSGIRRELMHPIFERKILHPPMLAATVIGHDVHNDLYAFLMCLFHIFLVKVICSEARVDLVVVRCRITVVRASSCIILKERSSPDGCSSKFGNIIKVIDNSLDITSVTTSKPASISLLGCIFSGIIRRISIRKAVRHDEIHHISRSEALALSRTLCTGSYLIRVFE